MKTALITTTVNVPEILRTYRKFDPDVTFFVAGDKKTPHKKCGRLADEIGNMMYYNVEDQKRLGYECSELIGWNTIRRRNIALLEALKFGAEIVITIDDDNYPLYSTYFKDFERILTTKFDGLMAISRSGWFNTGEYVIPKVYHRGFPYKLLHLVVYVAVQFLFDLSSPLYLFSRR